MVFGNKNNNNHRCTGYQDIINTDDEGVRHAERICIFVMCILNTVYPLQHVLEQIFRVRLVGGSITYVVRSIWSFPPENNIIIPKKISERVNLNARLLFCENLHIRYNIII